MKYSKSKPNRNTGGLSPRNSAQELQQKNYEILVDGWLQSYLPESGMTLNCPPPQQREYYRRVFGILLWHALAPSRDESLGQLSGLLAVPAEAEKMLQAFEARLAEIGWKADRAALEAAKRAARMSLFEWADLAIRRVLESTHMEVIEGRLLTDPRFQVHLTMVMVEHLGHRNVQETIEQLSLLDCSGDLKKVVARFDQAWSAHIARVIEGQKTPAEKERDGVMQEVAQRAATVLRQWEAADRGTPEVPAV